MVSSSLTHNLTMTLLDLLAAYVASRETSSRYRESLLRTARKATAAGLASIDDLQPVLVNRFLAGLSILTPTTRANIRRELLTLWRYAFEEGLTDSRPERVARIRPSYSAPQAYSDSMLASMLAAASKDETLVGGKTKARVCDLMPAWIGIAYDSGLRFGDVLCLQNDNIRNGMVVTTASKTRKPLVRRLSVGALEDIRALQAIALDDTLFLWAMPRRRAINTWRAFLDRHGFGGSSKWLRRSCATYVEMERPGMASRFLQHSHPSLAPTHYLDESLFAVPDGPPPIRRHRC